MITTQLYPASRDNFFFSCQFNFHYAPTHSGSTPPSPYNGLRSPSTCSLSQDTGLSVKLPKTRSQSQTPNHSQHRLFNITLHIGSKQYMRSGDKTTRNQPMGRDHLTKLGLASFPGSPAPKHAYVLYLKPISPLMISGLNPSQIPEMLSWIYLLLAL